MSKKVYLIIGSTRPNRIGKQVADWVASHVTNEAINLEVVDLKDWNLPLFEKPYSPAYTEKLDDDIQPWADKIAAAEGFIFVTPEYNRGLPASLKSAIDHLGNEWKEKPSVIVSYGYIDGGASAAKHLHDVLDWFKAPVMEPGVAIALKHGDAGADGFVDATATLSPFVADLKKAVDALAQA